MAQSLPMTCTATIVTDSHWVGFTLPGIMELVIRDKLLTKEQLDIILNPVSMTEPGISGIEAMNKMGGL